MLLKGPARLDENGFEALLDAAGRAAGSVEGIDLRGVASADPYGVLGLACIGSSEVFRGNQAWGLALPENRRVLSFLEKSGALDLLSRQFVLEAGPGRESPPAGGREQETLLEVTVIREPADVHRAVARVKGRTDRLLVNRLGYNALAADRFTVAVAEICQNIVDHSGGEGFAAARYQGSPGSGGLVSLAVCDTGIGVRRSLSARYGSSRVEWSDREALRLAFRRGVSRFDEPGRGLGLKLVAEMVRGWGGRLLLRSGTAAFAIAPTRGGRPRRAGLTFFPGTQVAIQLPALPG